MPGHCTKMLLHSIDKGSLARSCRQGWRKTDYMQWDFSNLIRKEKVSVFHSVAYTLEKKINQLKYQFTQLEIIVNHGERI